MRIPSGVTDQYIYFVAVDATDFTSRETGLSSFTVYRSRNGGAAAAMTTPTINETDTTNMPGVYELLLDEDMTIDAGDDAQEMAFHITHAGMAPVTRTIELYRPKVTAGYTLGVGSDGDLLEVNTLTGHTAQTGDSYARLGAPAGASVSADIATVDSNVDAILADTGTDGVLLAGAAVDAVWDEIITGAAHNTANSAGRRLRFASEATPVLQEGTAQAGAAGTITLAAAADGTNDNIYEDALISILSGTGSGQIRAIISYTASTRVATVHENWAVTPDATSVYSIAGSSAANVHAIGDSTAAAANLLADYDGTGYDKANSTIGTVTNIAAAEITAIADAILNRDMSAVSDTNARTLLNAARLLRNKYSVSGSTLTVTKEDDATTAWTSVLTTDATADPVTGSDPA